MPAALPTSTRRCFDCGIGSGPCQCTPEFTLYEQHQETLREVEDEWLAYIDTLVEEEGL